MSFAQQTAALAPLGCQRDPLPNTLPQQTNPRSTNQPQTARAARAAPGRHALYEITLDNWQHPTLLDDQEAQP